MEQFIGSVRKFPCLWKTDSLEYKNSDIKDMAWLEVVKDCDISDVRQAKAVWKKLRDGHRQALYKKKSTSSQAPTNTFPWRYQRLMEFLIPYIGSRPKNTMLKIPPIKEVFVDNPKYYEHFLESMTDSVKSNNSQQEQSPDTTDYLDHSLSDVPEETHDSQKREYAHSSFSIAQKKAKMDDHSDESLHSLEELVEEKSGIDYFFHSMCEQSKSLSEYLQLRVQKRIFNAVMEAREEQHALHYLSTSTSNTT